MPWPGPRNENKSDHCGKSMGLSACNPQDEKTRPVNRNNPPRKTRWLRPNWIDNLQIPLPQRLRNLDAQLGMVALANPQDGVSPAFFARFSGANVRPEASGKCDQGIARALRHEPA